jgi:hypothetical protein
MTPIIQEINPLDTSDDTQNRLRASCSELQVTLDLSDAIISDVALCIVFSVPPTKSHTQIELEYRTVNFVYRNLHAAISLPNKHVNSPIRTRNVLGRGVPRSREWSVPWACAWRSRVLTVTWCTS